MRIVYTVFSSSIGGGETVCLQIMRAARKHGHEVCLIVPQKGPLTDIVEAEGIEVFVLPMQRTFQCHKAIAFARFLKRWRADLVHCHDVLPGMVLARLGGWLAHIPVISHIHTEHTFNRRAIVRAFQIGIDNFTAMYSGPILTVSEATKRNLVNQGIPAQRMCTVPNGVKIGAVPSPQMADNARTRLNVTPTAKVVGCVGRLSEAKGQRDLLLAASEICKAESDVSFVLIGEDPLPDGHFRNELGALVDRLRLAEHVQFAGYQIDADVLMSGFDIFVLPSYKEAMPLSILEAMAAGKPVIATNIGGIPEVVLDGITGYLVSPGQPELLATALLTLLSDPVKAQAMGHAGQERVEAHFDLDKVNGRIIQLYETVTHCD